MSSSASTRSEQGFQQNFEINERVEKHYSHSLNALCLLIFRYHLHQGDSGYEITQKNDKDQMKTKKN